MSLRVWCVNCSKSYAEHFGDNCFPNSPGGPTYKSSDEDEEREAAIEQRTAEAIATWLESLPHALWPYNIAHDIRSGAWKVTP